MDPAKNQTKEQNQDGDKESKSEDSTKLENGADPLSLVLDGSYNEEDDAGTLYVMYLIEHLGVSFRKHLLVNIESYRS